MFIITCPRTVLCSCHSKLLHFTWPDNLTGTTRFSECKISKHIKTTYISICPLNETHPSFIYLVCFVFVQSMLHKQKKIRKKNQTTRACMCICVIHVIQYNITHIHMIYVHILHMHMTHNIYNT